MTELTTAKERQYNMTLLGKSQLEDDFLKHLDFTERLIDHVEDAERRASEAEAEAARLREAQSCIACRAAHKLHTGTP